MTKFFERLEEIFIFVPIGIGLAVAISASVIALLNHYLGVNIDFTTENILFLSYILDTFGG